VPFPPPEITALVVLLCGVLSALAYVKNVLTWDGSLAAFLVGLLIGVLGHFTWLLLLLFFLLSSFAATRYRFALKEALGVQEGRRGERRASNVLANGLAPVFVAGLAFLETPWFPRSLSGLIYISVLAVAGADTIASEIGVLSPNAYLFVTGRKVPPGTNGAVSVLGQLCALAAALYTAIFGWVFLALNPPAYGFVVTVPANAALLAIPVAVGFIGCQIDSLLGETLERRGYIGKTTVNLIATSVGGVIAYVLLWAPTGVLPA